MLKNLIWAWRVFRAKAFVVCTQEAAVCSINLRDPSSFDNIIMLSAQYSSLVEFSEKLQEVVKEHEQVSKHLFGEKPHNYKEVK
jgi:hypothetical protein